MRLKQECQRYLHMYVHIWQYVCMFVCIYVHMNPGASFKVSLNAVMALFKFNMLNKHTIICIYMHTYIHIYTYRQKKKIKFILNPSRMRWKCNKPVKAQKICCNIVAHWYLATGMIGNWDDQRLQHCKNSIEEQESDRTRFRVYIHTYAFFGTSTKPIAISVRSKTRTRRIQFGLRLLFCLLYKWRKWWVCWACMFDCFCSNNDI